MFKHISVVDTHNMMQEQSVTIVDIRDPMSFQGGHIPGAIALNNDNLAEFIASADKNLPLLVCCYHGNSSQGAADFLNEKGFSDVYSIDGGFAAWHLNFEVEK